MTDATGGGKDMIGGAPRLEAASRYEVDDCSQLVAATSETQYLCLLRATSCFVREAVWLLKRMSLSNAMLMRK